VTVYERKKCVCVREKEAEHIMLAVTHSVNILCWLNKQRVFTVSFITHTHTRTHSWSYYSTQEIYQIYPHTHRSVY